MEKYGTIPPKFTKQWWSYFWDYYKIHTISICAAAVLIGTTVYQCATQTKYDLSVSYIGTQDITEEQEAKLSEIIKPEIDEITGNKEIDIDYMTYPINPNNTDKSASEYEYAMQMKYTAELQAGTTDLYIMSRDNAEANKTYADCFTDISELTDNADDVLTDDSGRAYAVSLKNSRALKEAGIDSSDMYLSLRLLFEMNEKKDEYVLNHENALKAAKLLLEE